MSTAFTYEPLTIEQSRWYGANEACFIVRFASGFAPISNYARIVNGKFASNPETGYIHGNGNTGTGSMLIRDINKL